MRARALLGVTRGIPGLIIRALLSARFLPLHCIITFVAEETSWKFHEVCRRDAARLSADQEEEAEEKGEERERERSERCNGVDTTEEHGPDRIPTRRVMRTYQHRSACYLLSNGYPQPRTKRATRPPRSKRLPQIYLERVAPL